MKADVNGRNQEAVQSVLHKIISRKDQRSVLVTTSLHDNINALNQRKRLQCLFYRRIIWQKKQQYEAAQYRSMIVRD